MFRNILSIAILAFLSAFSINEVFGQERQEKHRVVVIEKSMDENGQVVEKKVVKEGEEAKAYLEDMGEQELLDGQGVAGAMKKQIRLKVKDEEGNEKILEWDGEGEMPEGMEELLKNEDLQLGELHTSESKEIELDVDVQKEGDMTKIKIVQTENGEKEVLEFEYEGDEIPEEIRKELEKRGINLDQEAPENGGTMIKVEKKTDKPSKPATTKKAQLGVNIESHPIGVRISGVLPESSAERAGLKTGDIITQVNDQKVAEVEELVNAIRGKKPGDVIIVRYDRGGQMESQEVVLMERVDPFPYKTWEEVMNLKGGKSKTIDIEKEIIIEKEK